MYVHELNSCVRWYASWLNVFREQDAMSFQLEGEEIEVCSSVGFDEKDSI